jgi:hypothetical protein
LTLKATVAGGGFRFAIGSRKPWVGKRKDGLSSEIAMKFDEKVVASLIGCLPALSGSQGSPLEAVALVVASVASVAHRLQVSRNRK